MPCPSQGRGVSHPVGTLPRWSSSPPARSLRPAPQGDAPVDRGTGGEVLALLRGDAAARPRFDPGLAGGLRAWLEDAAYDVVAARGDHAPPLFLGPRQLLGSHDRADGDDSVGDGLRRCRDSSTRCCASSCTPERSTTRWPTRSTRCGRPATMLRSGTIEALPATARAVLAETLCRPRPQPDRAGPPVRPGLDAADQRPRRHPAGRRTGRPPRGLRPRRRAARSSTRRRCARSGCPPAGRGRRSGAHCTTCRCSRPSGAARRRSGWRCLESASGRYGVEDVREEHLRAIASHIWRRGWPRPAPTMDSRLMDALVAPVPAVDAASWRVRPRRRPSRSWPAWPSGAPGRSASGSPTTRCARRSPRDAAGSRRTPSRSPGRRARRGGPSAWPRCACWRTGGALAARGGAEPAGRVVPLGARRQLLGHAARPLGRRRSRRPAGPPSAPRP